MYFGYYVKGDDDLTPLHGPWKRKLVCLELSLAETRKQAVRAVTGPLGSRRLSSSQPLVASTLGV